MGSNRHYTNGHFLDFFHSQWQRSGVMGFELGLIVDFYKGVPGDNVLLEMSITLC